MRTLTCLALFLGSVFLLVERGDSAVITGACERDLQCGGGMCCAVSLWIRGLRMCTPLGNEGEDCHPLSHKIPYSGKRMVHKCPCLPNLTCMKLDDGRYQCLPYLKGKNYYY
ncbi:PREDICTED: prokineticin-2 [Nanorana parkeri]|uniref:prokineticin-2 n=1 Tax=Nanorana parkeri TaxID=125878 RepID=UPI000853FCFD|nr:PREDICTED: prokineticin-2 [Nanorana parkeri]